MSTAIIEPTESSTVLWKVLRAARFELAFVGGMVLIYLMVVLMRSKNRYAKGHLPKKHHTSSRSVPTDREDRSRAVRRASDKRDVVEAPTASDGNLALSSRELMAILSTKDQAYSPLLKDHTWLIPRVIDTCATDAQQALLVYREAEKVGLDLAAANRKDREQLFTALVTSVIRLGMPSEAKQLIQRLLASGSVVTPNLRTSIVKLCASKQFFQEAVELHDMCPVNDTDPTFRPLDKNVWSCLLFCSVEVKAYHRCREFFARLKACGSPSLKDYWNMIRWGSAQGDWNTILELMQEMREHNVEPDNVIFNTALASCVTAGQVGHARRLFDEMSAIDGVADVITYNTLMKGYAKIGKMDECFKLFGLIREGGHTPSQVTYGIILDGYINNNDVENAAKIFQVMQDDGCLMNTVLYTTLIKGFAREGKVDEAMRIYEQMSQNSVTPDLITFSVLLKVNCDAGMLEQALGLLNAMVKSGLKPDEVIFNNLLAGCAVSSKFEFAKQLYRDMIESGVKPSNATFSILIRLYSTGKLLDEAVTMLTTEPSKHGVVVESRIYVQLISSCIRARQGRRAVEVCRLMHERSMPTPASMSTLLVASIKLNMYETAADIMACSAAFNGRIDARDANMVLQCARKKKKDTCIESCLASMQTLGLKVDS